MEIRERDQLERIKKLQGTDNGLFALAICSYIEWFCKKELGISKCDSFPDLLINYSKTTGYENLDDKKDICKKIKEDHRLSNDVRHFFEPLDDEQLRKAIIHFKNFARIYNLNNTDIIYNLWDETQWKQRKSPEESASLLNEAIKENRKLREDFEELNKNLAEYAELHEKLEEAELTIAKLEADKSANTDQYLQEIKKEKEIQAELEEKLKSYEKEEIYSNNLRELISYTRTRREYEQVSIRLTEQQESIVKQINFMHDFLIKGSAGTGKSLVLLKTIERYIKEEKCRDHNFVLLTFGRSLTKFNVYMAKLLGMEDSLKNEILTADAFIANIINEVYGKRPAYQNLFLPEIIDKMDASSLPVLKNELLNEIRENIFPNVLNREEYLSVKSPVLQHKLTAESKEKLWDIFSQIETTLEAKKTFDSDYIFYKLAKELKNKSISIPDNLKKDYIFIDEVQDLSAAKLIILKQCSKNNLMLAGDKNQTIRQPLFSWKRAGINVMGRTRILNTIFRNTIQLTKLAENYCNTIDIQYNTLEENATTPKMSVSNTENLSSSFRVGPEPELQIVVNSDDAQTRIANSIVYCIKELGYEPGNICIITNNKIEKYTISSLIRKILNIEIEEISSSNFDFSNSKTIKYATIQHAKGLDFPVVLYYIDDEYHVAKQFEDEIRFKMNRTAIYTAITRAMDYIQIFVNEGISIPPVSNLIDCFKK